MILNREEFIDAMAERIIMNGGFNEDETVEAKDFVGEMLESFLDWEDIEYGDPDYSWNKDSAYEMIDLEMSYWEVD